MYLSCGHISILLLEAPFEGGHFMLKQFAYPPLGEPVPTIRGAGGGNLLFSIMCPHDSVCTGWKFRKEREEVAETLSIS